MSRNETIPTVRPTDDMTGAFTADIRIKFGCLIKLRSFELAQVSSCPSSTISGRGSDFRGPNELRIPKELWIPYFHVLSFTIIYNNNQAKTCDYAGRPALRPFMASLEHIRSLSRRLG